MWAVWLVLLALILMTAAVLGEGLGQWRRPLAGVMVDPFGRITTYGWPGWNGYEAGLAYPDIVMGIDGKPLKVPRPAALEAAIREAQHAGRESLTLTVARGDQWRDVRVRIEPLGFQPWLLLCGGPLVLSWLWLLTAALSYVLRPNGRAVRVFLRWVLLGAVALITGFDAHTTRKLAPLWLAAIALSPMTMLEFGLFFPERLRLIAARPRLLYVLRAVDVAALGLLGYGWLRGESFLFVTDLLFMVAVVTLSAVLVWRCLRAEGRRRIQILFGLLLLTPVHLLLASGFILPGWMGPWVSMVWVPMLTLTAPLLGYAAVRYDLWNSRAVLQRRAVRPLLAVGLGVFGGLLCALSFLMLKSGPLWAQLGLVVSVAALLGPVHQRLVDWIEAHLFKADALYRHTVEQLSVRFSDLGSQSAVVETVEQAVHRVYDCERVRLVPIPTAPTVTQPDPGRGLAVSGERWAGESTSSFENPVTPAAASPPIYVNDAPSGASGGGQRPAWRGLRRTATAAGLFGLSSEHAAALSRGELVYLAPAAPPGDSAPVMWSWLVIAARFRDEIVGLLAVAPRQETRLLTSEDQALLRTIANQAALALACARALEEVDGLRRAQEAASRQQLDTAIGTLAAEIAHEIRFPTNFFRVLMEREQQALREGQNLSAADLDEDLDIGREEVARLERMADTLRRVAQRRPLVRRLQPLRPIFLHAQMLLRDRLSGRTLELDIDPALAADCDRDAVTQVLLNILANALEACPAPGRVGVATVVEPDGRLRLVVWDTGPGFPEPVGKLFQAWFTTKQSGSGLGLAIAHRLVRAHGWTLGAERRGDRTCFDLLIAAGEWQHSTEAHAPDDGDDPEDPAEPQHPEDEP